MAGKKETAEQYEIAKRFNAEDGRYFRPRTAQRATVVTAKDFKKAEFDRLVEEGYLKPATQTAIRTVEKAAAEETEAPAENPVVKSEKLSPEEAGLTNGDAENKKGDK